MLSRIWIGPVFIFATLAATGCGDEKQQAPDVQEAVAVEPTAVRIAEVSSIAFVSPAAAPEPAVQASVDGRHAEVFSAVSESTSSQNVGSVTVSSAANQFSIGYAANFQYDPGLYGAAAAWLNTHAASGYESDFIEGACETARTQTIPDAALTFQALLLEVANVSGETLGGEAVILPELWNAYGKALSDHCTSSP